MANQTTVASEIGALETTVATLVSTASPSAPVAASLARALSLVNAGQEPLALKYLVYAMAQLQLEYTATKS